MHECFAGIERGNAEQMVRDARRIIRKERWDADARACLAMAYYRMGKTDFAFRGLKEAEDTIPKESIDVMHDKIWTYLPELLAEKEYKDFHAFAGGDCILRNVTALEGNGTLILGYFYNPETGKRIRHIRAEKCDAGMKPCLEIDKVCPLCRLEEKEAIITIRDYNISSVERLKRDVPIERNMRYIKKILDLEKK